MIQELTMDDKIIILEQQISHEFTKLSVQYSFLDKGLSSNSELSSEIFATQKAGYLKHLDRLFEELYSGSCKGIEIKVNETADLFRFESLISELEFARYFIRNKMQVELLASNAFQGRRAPDMLVFGDSKKYFAEVKNIQLDDESYDFGSEIAEALNTLRMSFMVVVKASSLLSTPAYKYQTKDQKEKECRDAIEEFKDKVKKTPLDSPAISISTKIADIGLHPTKKSKSYLGIETMLQAISEPLEYKGRIKYDLIQKSKKREDWTGDELNKLYIVAIDDDSIFFYIDRYNADLFGDATYYSPPLPVPETKIDATIDYALKHGWKEYLTKMCVLRNNRSVIPENKRGMLFTEPALKNVTAMLIRHRTEFHLLANPFADGKINNANIIAELKGCLVGWEK
jgi:hypothetical protein